MARAKSPRNGGTRTKQATPETNVATMPEVTENNVATMPEVTEPTETKRPTNGEAPAADTRKHVSPIPINVEDEIRRRAYEIFEQRGYSHGSDYEDWLAAEREVLARYRQQTA